MTLREAMIKAVKTDDMHLMEDVVNQYRYQLGYTQEKLRREFVAHEGVTGEQFEDICDRLGNQ